MRTSSRPTLSSSPSPPAIAHPLLMSNDPVRAPEPIPTQSSSASSSTPGTVLPHPMPPSMYNKEDPSCPILCPCLSIPQCRTKKMSSSCVCRERPPSVGRSKVYVGCSPRSGCRLLPLFWRHCRTLSFLRYFAGLRLNSLFPFLVTASFAERVFGAGLSINDHRRHASLREQRTSIGSVISRVVR